MFLQSGGNALKVADSVRAGIARLEQSFPQGVTQVIPFDTTRFVRSSIHEVIITLSEAAALVLLVVFVFLQSWRATLIPIIAVPVSLIGAFGGLMLFGFTLNTLTLFAIVLATGIVVDDAIVVLENVERLMAEKKLSPKDAAIESMKEVTGAIVAIELVLVSVFVPVAFLGGLAGKLYQQFAVTVATAVTISGLIALTLTPALCALLLKPQHIENRLFRPFNRGFAWLTRTYLGGVRLTVRHAVIAILLFVGVLGADALLFRTVPGGFVPPEDQGYILGSLTLPDAATLQRTAEAGATIQRILLGHPAVEHVFVVAGFDVIAGANKSNAATMFIPLQPWDERKTTAEDLAKYVMAEGAKLSQGTLLAFNPAAIRGLGSAGGFEVYLQDRADADPQKLYQNLQQFLGELRKRQELTGIASFYRPTSPQLFVDVDREKAAALGVPLKDVFDTLQGTMGVLYVNDFNKFGHTYRVQLQAEGRVSVEAGRSGQRVRPFLARRHDSGEGADQREERHRTRADRSLQRLPRGQGARQQRGRRELRAGDRRGRGRREIASARLYDRLDRAGIPGKTHRHPVDHRVHVRDHHGVPDPVGELREMVAAGGGAAGRARSRCSAR